MNPQERPAASQALGEGPSCKGYDERSRSTRDFVRVKGGLGLRGESSGNRRCQTPGPPTPAEVRHIFERGKRRCSAVMRFDTERHPFWFRNKRVLCEVVSKYLLASGALTRNVWSWCAGWDMYDCTRAARQRQARSALAPTRRNSRSLCCMNLHVLSPTTRGQQLYGLRARHGDGTQ